MDELKRIKVQLRGTFSGRAWHGDSLMKILDGVTAEQAMQKPIPDAHSIWELALHINAWQKAGVRILAGEVVMDLPEEENFPTIPDASEEAWQAAVSELKDGHREFRNVVSKLSEDDLEKTVAGRDFAVYFLLHGVIHHNLYHAGQIALLKKAFA